MNLIYKTANSPVGLLTLVAKVGDENDEGVLVALLWPTEKENRVKLGSMTRADDLPLLLRCELQLNEYFAGTRQRFDLPLDPNGTDFQKRVWLKLREIPYGETRSYRQLAESLGTSKAVRAVGGANGRNPLSIIVPCHRVIGSDGSLTGFAGGVEAKRLLLNLEKINLSKDSNRPGR